jgi:adenine-specific DNA-methyltransferase
MTIESFKHKNQKRAHIPSKEEAGYETTNPVVQAKKTAEYPVNPIVQRGQDPELWWLDKYGPANQQAEVEVDIRSLYRYEHISPTVLMQNLYRLKEVKAPQLSLLNDLFGNALERDELEKVSEYYQHADGWTNRLIQGDSLLVMSSLLEREGMAGKVQMIYLDPPYGIKYGSNWQLKMNDRNVKDGDDEALTGEPEQIRAFRDTWELGVHSYLSYLRDRLLVARELLTETGSCFVQISDENVHLVRCVMDEVFGSGNFVSLITFNKANWVVTAKLLSSGVDYVIWYSKDITVLKYRQLYKAQSLDSSTGRRYDYVLDLNAGQDRRRTSEESQTPKLLGSNLKVFKKDILVSEEGGNNAFEYEFKERLYTPGKGRNWKTNRAGLDRLKSLNRLTVTSKGNLSYIRFFDDFPWTEMSNVWSDLGAESEKLYVVQTSLAAIQRCLLMTTDPGDLVLDPTCGSGTTAYVAEQWGRRWITIDTSRIAINIAKIRLMTATFPYYLLQDTAGQDVRHGFQYKTVPHITLKSLANDEPPETETLYDQPVVDNKKLRVAGEFTVETLQSYEPIAPEELEKEKVSDDFEQTLFEHLKTAGIKTGIKDETAVFIRLEPLNDAYLHAEGYYQTRQGEKKAYLHIGPKFGSVSKLAVNDSLKACRSRGDANWLIILGFSFDSDVSNQTVTTRVGGFELTKVRMHDDLLQTGLRKKDKKAGSFITIGEPEVKIHSNKKEKTVQVEICGLDIYDPIKDMVLARSLYHIAYWMVDDDYDDSNFVAKQIFFCGGDKDEFSKWRKGLGTLAKSAEVTRKNVQKTLKIELDEEAFDRVYGHLSHPITITKARQKIAVRVVSQFGEESTKVCVV